MQYISSLTLYTKQTEKYLNGTLKDLYLLYNLLGFPESSRQSATPKTDTKVEIEWRDIIISWIEQWLNGRRQQVVVDGEVPNLKSIFGRVPQGSVL